LVLLAIFRNDFQALQWPASPRETIFVRKIPDFIALAMKAALRHLISCNRGACGAGFLRKPMGNVPKTDAVSQRLLDIEQLRLPKERSALTTH